MEYVLNWMVLILSLGGIALVAFMCYTDLARRRTQAYEASTPITDMPVETQQEEVIAAADISSGPYIELAYRRGGAVEYIQKIPAGSIGYIGTESYPELGKGMPVRYIEVDWRNGEPTCSNLDWQEPVNMTAPDGTEVQVPVGQPVQLQDGCELTLSGGWTVSCRTVEGREG